MPPESHALLLRCLAGANGCWLLMAGRRVIAAFASRGEAGDYARDLIARGVTVSVRFEDGFSSGD